MVRPPDQPRVRIPAIAPERHHNAAVSVTLVNLSRVSPSVALAACAASFVVALAACGSDSEAKSAPADPPTTASGCPTAAPQSGGTPEWTLAGSTGNVAVTGSTDTAAPSINVTAPFSVTETQVHTLQAGTGTIVGDLATVSVCYMGVNGRDGSVFDSSYERGTPAQFPLGGVVPGFKKAIAGQKVGSTVAVAMNSADGYPAGQPSAGIRAGDSLVFAIKILNATN